MDVSVGDELAPFRREAGFHAWNRYAAVNEEFVPMHMDDVAAQHAGFPTAFGMGHLQVSYLHAMLRHWIGESGRVVRVSCQYRAPIHRPAVTTARGRVVDVRHGAAETVIELEVWTENDDGTAPTRGAATVAFPR